VTGAVFLPSLWNGFAMDDEFLARSQLPDGAPNPMVDGTASLWETFTSHYWKGGGGEDRLYRPVTILSYRLIHVGCTDLFGSEAPAQHLANVLLHLLAVFLVHRLLAALGAGGRAAFFGALLFGVHAVHSEVVASVTGRAELLGFCFGAAAVLLFMKAREKQERASGVRLLAVASLLLFAAFCSKESALAWLPFLPVLLAARAWIIGTGESAANALRGHLPSMLCFSIPPLALFFVLRHIALGELPDELSISYVVNPLIGASLVERLATGTMLWAYGMAKTLAPFPLYSDYGAEVFEHARSLGDWRFLLSLPALLAVLAAGLARPRRAPLLFTAAACFFGFGFLTSNIPIAIGVLFAERLYYTPSLALSFVLAFLLLRSAGKARTAVTAIAIAWMILSAGAAVQRCLVWRDTATIVLHDVERQPRSLRLLQAAAHEHKERGDLETAREYVLRASLLQPGEPSIWMFLGMLDLMQDDARKAEEHFRRGIEAELFDGALHGARLETCLGRALLQQGKEQEALEAFRRALTREPENLEALKEILQIADLVPEREFLMYLAAGERAQPGYPLWAIHRGLEAQKDGDHGKAVAEFGKALRQWPDHWGAHRSMGTSLLALGRKDAALQHLRRVAADRRVPPALRAEVNAEIRLITGK
jgi:tetratricopeptide (TPR) repeat protein